MHCAYLILYRKSKCNHNQVVISQAKEDTDLWGRELDMNLLLGAKAQGVCPSFGTSNIFLVPNYKL